MSDRERNERKSDTFTFHDQLTVDPINDEIEREYQQTVVDSCITALSGRQREVVELYVSGSHHFTVIGAVLDISPSTARTYFRRAIKKMRLVVTL